MATMFKCMGKETRKCGWLDTGTGDREYCNRAQRSDSSEETDSKILSQFLAPRNF